ncbi:RHS repeat-associated core domain-containing protein [Treponema putidum]|uniref:RHS repeat-associated core domain-containing protein n=2 Tax=Treponema putidum TaxID=221027 RepID=A0AAE9MWD8_9SPIR|nr:RHS repeat-associated core domain-containing protein [Treponema putidum]UTY34298.1 RHS repeat-associated core domain-containing protein [Treponema putidum]
MMIQVLDLYASKIRKFTMRIYFLKMYRNFQILRALLRAMRGLYYNRYRWYNSETGCYISQDPISILGGLNLYSYVFGVNGWVDIFGLSATYLHHTIPREVYNLRSVKNENI